MVARMGRPGSRSGDRGGCLGGGPASDERRCESSRFLFIAETGDAATEHTATSDTGGARTRRAAGDSRKTDAAGPRTIR